jgi:7-cyano-7-deazaguanine reductase
MNAELEGTSLGKPVEYVDVYTPSLLEGIARASMREDLGIDGNALPFTGIDLWTGYELSWLNRKGRPEVAALRVTIPAQSSHIPESKAFKLYLNSFSNSQFVSRQDVENTIESDLKLAVRAPVIVEVLPLDQLGAPSGQFTGETLDVIDTPVDCYEVDPDLLPPPEASAVRETVFTHLLRTLCPVTGQPDWGSLWIQYAGPEIDRACLLRYIVSYRNHRGFHEETVERMFMDLMERCEPTSLSICARYLRRGGLDINPFRSTRDTQAPGVRLNRQ